MIAIALFFASKLTNSKKNRPVTDDKVVQTVFTETVQNSAIPITVIESGRLMAKDRIELFTEVQGVMESTRKEFKPGAIYKKGEIMVKIRSEDFFANLQSKKAIS